MFCCSPPYIEGGSPNGGVESHVARLSKIKNLHRYLCEDGFLGFEIVLMSLFLYFCSKPLISPIDGVEICHVIFACARHGYLQQQHHNKYKEECQMLQQVCKGVEEVIVANKEHLGPKQQ